MCTVIGILVTLPLFIGFRFIRFQTQHLKFWACTFENRPKQQRWMFRLNSVSSNAAMEEWLEDVIYSGDVRGFIRRRSKDLVSYDFLDFLDSKLESCDDPDLKEVLTDMIEDIEGKLEQNDGLVDAELVFENRFNKIIFTPPNLRREYIDQHKKDMTPGFVQYVQNELKIMDDIDSKVVIATVLHMIGQVKNADLLGNEASLLKNADASLGEEFSVNNQMEANSENSDSSVSASGLILDGSQVSKNALALAEQARKSDEKLVGDRNEQVS